MLREFKSVKQHADDLFRRWFEDDFFDLIVWYNNNEDGSNTSVGGREIFGFQLCYDKNGRECAVTWLKTTGYSHEIIDSGEKSAWDIKTPVLSGAQAFPRERIIESFAERSKEIEAELANYVMQKLAAYV